MMYRRFVTILLACALLAGASLGAQTKKPAAKKPKPKTQVKKQQPNSESRAVDELEEATKKYKKDLEEEIETREANFKKIVATEKLEEKKLLFQAGIASKADIEKSEAIIAAARADLNERKQLLQQAEGIIAEVQAMEKLLTMPKPKLGSYTTTNALIRYLGPSQWTLENISKVSSFFVGSFGRQLPISAFGQSAVHDRMNFDHRNSVDVAIHPDSAEGQALMSYLRSQGIPFLAFRSAVPGAATGAHIHIGHPSHRIR